MILSKRFFLNLSTLCFILNYINLWSIIPYEQGMGSDFDIIRYPFTKLFKKTYETNNYEVAYFYEKPLIPKIIHQIWVGGELPERFKKLTQTWPLKHPRWIYKLWTDGDIPNFKFLNKRAFDAAVNMGAKADIWRYEILNMYGGVYLDIDYECIQPLDKIHHTCEFYATTCSNDDVIGNGIIGSVPQHPLLKHCINQISQLTVAQLADPWTFTGPKLITKCVISYLWHQRFNQQDKTAIYPTLFFHPFPDQYRKKYWQGKIPRDFVEKFLIPETFAIHFWATSWQ